MLQVKYLKENKEDIIQRLAIKNFDGIDIIETVITLDEERKNLQQELDEILNRSNTAAKEIGGLYKQGKKEEAEKLKTITVQLKDKAKSLQTQLSDVSAELSTALLKIPNVPHKSVPPGKGEQDNEVIHTEGEIPTLGKNALPHWDLIKKYDIIDFELGNKVSGAGFPFYKKEGAKLQRALINFFIDQAIQNGYSEILPPLVVNEASGCGTGQLPDKDGQMYGLSNDPLYLIPTAEVPVTNMYRDVILHEKDLPVKNVAFSSCFRREAGSWGSDVRGLNRLHQFEKVEIVQITHPEKSYEVLEEMKDYVTGLVRLLNLPFRILKLCGGDTSFTSALTYDFEVYSAAQKKWLEVSSVSNFENFQANRMKLRFKGKQGGTTLAHTLNGSALALPRIVAAILENNQTEKGIQIPTVLQAFTGFEYIT